MQGLPEAGPVGTRAVAGEGSGLDDNQLVIIRFYVSSIVLNTSVAMSVSPFFTPTPGERDFHFIYGET